jgi:hypothetical protein
MRKQTRDVLLLRSISRVVTVGNTPSEHLEAQLAQRFLEPVIPRNEVNISEALTRYSENITILGHLKRIF